MQNLWVNIKGRNNVTKARASLNTETTSEGPAKPGPDYSNSFPQPQVTRQPKVTHGHNDILTFKRTEDIMASCLQTVLNTMIKIKQGQVLRETQQGA